jgi:hypothetical protein
MPVVNELQSTWGILYRYEHISKLRVLWSEAQIITYFK